MKRLVRRAAKATTSNARRAGYLVAGVLMLALGIVGAFLPLMPTTIFLIASAWCFGRSSPRIEGWLLSHPTFGPPLVAWREEGAIPRRGKIMACLGMALGYGLFWLGEPAPLSAAAATIFVGAGASYVLSRPAPKVRSARAERRDEG